MRGFKNGYVGEALGELFDEYGDIINTRILFEDQVGSFSLHMGYVRFVDLCL